MTNKKRKLSLCEPTEKEIQKDLEIALQKMPILLKKTRICCGLSLHEAADLLKIDRSRLRNYEKGHGNMLSASLFRIVITYTRTMRENDIKVIPNMEIIYDFLTLIEDKILETIVDSDKRSYLCK